MDAFWKPRDANFRVIMNWKGYICRIAPQFSGIENIEIESSAAENGIYDLMGRKVANPVSNQLYIKDGKKYIYKD